MGLRADVLRLPSTAYAERKSSKDLGHWRGKGYMARWTSQAMSAIEFRNVHVFSISICIYAWHQN